MHSVYPIKIRECEFGRPWNMVGCAWMETDPETRKSPVEVVGGTGNYDGKCIYFGSWTL